LGDLPDVLEPLLRLIPLHLVALALVEIGSLGRRVAVFRAVRVKASVAVDLEFLWNRDCAVLAGR
jgi:hypothetical protein